MRIIADAETGTEKGGAIGHLFITEYGPRSFVRANPRLGLLNVNGYLCTYFLAAIFVASGVSKGDLLGENAVELSQLIMITYIFLKLFVAVINGWLYIPYTYIHMYECNVRKRFRFPIIGIDYVSIKHRSVIDSPGHGVSRSFA